MGSHRTGIETSALLAQKLGEHVWEEKRKGFWTTPAAWSKAPVVDTEDDYLTPSASSKKAGPDRSKKLATSSADSRLTEDLQQLLRVMDPEGRASIQPEILVVLLIWQGFARHRSASLKALAHAFGQGDISCAALLQLSDYADVQVRMAEGLRRITQRESVEHLCEFMMDGDMHVPRRWFGTMKRQPTGHVDVGQVSRWLALSDVMFGGQDLFRFLCHVDLQVVTAGHRAWQLANASTAYKKRNFRFEDFVCLLCRSAVTWCLVKTIGVLNPPGPGQRVTDRELGLRWAEFARHISVSFFVNRKFWGPEARQVAMSIRPAKAATIGQELPQQEWLVLFQRVRAQGMGTILPEGEDAGDPDFLRNLACQSGALAGPISVGGL